MEHVVGTGQPHSCCWENELRWLVEACIQEQTLNCGQCGLPGFARALVLLQKHHTPTWLLILEKETPF